MKEKTKRNLWRGLLLNFIIAFLGHKIFSIIFMFRLKKKRENENKKVQKKEQNETTNDTVNNATSTEKPNEAEIIL